MRMTTAYALAWISTAIGVSVAVIVTKNLWCLVAFAFPLNVSISSSKTE